MALDRCTARAAGEHFERAIALFEDAGETHAAARVEARLAEIMWDTGRLEEGLERMDRSFEDAVAGGARRRPRRRSRRRSDGSSSSPASSRPRVERIEIGARDSPRRSRFPRRSRRRSTRRRSCSSRTGASLEGIALLRYALEVALEHDKPSAALRAYVQPVGHTGQGSTATRRPKRLVSRRACIRTSCRQPLPGVPFPARAMSLFALGKWDEPRDGLAAPRRAGAREPTHTAIASVCTHHQRHIGRVEEAELDRPSRRVRHLRSTHRTCSDATGRARSPRDRGTCRRSAAAFRTAALEASDEMGFTQEYVKESLVTALEAAVELRDVSALVPAADLPRPDPAWDALEAARVRDRTRSRRCGIARGAARPGGRPLSSRRSRRRGTSANPCGSRESSPTTLRRWSARGGPTRQTRWRLKRARRSSGWARQGRSPGSTLA